MKYNIGIDIGGSKVNYGILNPQGEIVENRYIHSKPGIDPHFLINQTIDALFTLLADNGLTASDIHFIGAGVPGTVDSKTGYISYCPNLGWRDIPLGVILKKAFNTEVAVIQDTRAAAIGEYLYGAGQGCKDFICVVLGTGISAGIILDGKLYHGALNTAGEIGHMVIERNGRPCRCGQKGCLEKYCSGSALIEIARERFDEKLKDSKNTEIIFDLARQGDVDANRLIGECLDYLAWGLANVIDCLSVDTLIISGGISKHKDLVIDPLGGRINGYGFSAWASLGKLQVLQAKLGSNAPLIGASAMYHCL